MEAEYENGYYYLTSSSDSLLGEESGILRVKEEELEKFIFDMYIKNESIRVKLQSMFIEALGSGI